VLGRPPFGRGEGFPDAPLFEGGRRDAPLLGRHVLHAGETFPQTPHILQEWNLQLEVHDVLQLDEFGLKFFVHTGQRMIFSHWHIHWFKSLVELLDWCLLLDIFL
jgi:hypothetical protein